MRRSSKGWLAYFRGNADRAPPLLDLARAPADAELKRVLVRSLGHFYLGETGEGRIAHEAARSGDPALDEAMCESIVLYVREEGRHARALASALGSLGAPLPKRHYTEMLFRRARRLMGVRTKMMTMAIAEVVGLAFYETLEERVPSVAGIARALASDEREHLAFQAEYFARVIERSGRLAPVRAAALGAGYAAIAACAILTLVVDHAPLLHALGVTRREMALRCALEARRGVLACRALLREASPADDRVEESAPTAAHALARASRIMRVDGRFLREGERADARGTA